MPLPAPPARLHVVGKDDDVGVVALAADSAMAEAVVVDFHGQRLLVTVRN